jgi:RNA 2',3'-cyclic 3'-phosphodiesterase
MRLFFALWPDDDVRLALAAQRLEIARLTGGRPTMPVTLHMTMVFMGNVPASRMLELQTIASSVRVPRFNYAVDTAGCFEGPGVAWLASDSPPQGLFDLQSALFNAVKQADFDVDLRQFRPHITVARKIESAFEAYPINPVNWPVREFQLVHPAQTERGISYETIDRWPLA